jgi:hypothetical protein
MVTLVTGLPGAGKSTFFAFLMSYARRTVFLSKHDEPFASMMLPRLPLHGVDPATVRLLEGGAWELPNAVEDLAMIVRAMGADLVLFDPMGSFLPGGASPNEEQAVRAALDGAGAIAAATSAAVVGIRHPGKAAGNDVKGSAAWMEQPRSVVRLDYSRGPPEVRTISLAKPGPGGNPPERFFRLEGEEGQARRFVLGEFVDPGEAAARRGGNDLYAQSQLNGAVDLLQHFLAPGRQPHPAIILAASKEGISPTTIDRAAGILHVQKKREGFGPGQVSYWSLPDSALPPDSPQTPL